MLSTDPLALTQMLLASSAMLVASTSYVNNNYSAGKGEDVMKGGGA